MVSEDFILVYNRHAPDVGRFVRYLTGNPDLADELTAETFLRAWTSLGTIQVTTAKSYLIAIARNLVVDHYRRKPAAALDFDLAAPDEAPDSRRLLDQTMVAIQRLPEHYREPLVMHAISELPYEEIARSLNLPVTTVRMRIHRARLQLMEMLESVTEVTNHGAR